jgi:biopolymer transport protein ExbB/biopolymer transport protein TolQ
MAGSALARLIENGGVTLYPLLLCSIVSVAVAIERWWAIVRAARARRQVHPLVLRAATPGNVGEARAVVRMSGSPYTSVYEAVLTQGDAESRARLAERRDAASVRDLRRYVWLLGTIGSLAPFIGLFGTVVGIINAFTGIAQSGSGGLAAVSAGISEALITTAFGILVAVPAVMAFNYFTTRLERFQIEMSNSSAELLDFFLKKHEAASAKR